MNLADLRKPFAPEKISWRIGSTSKDKAKGMALAYIDARDVQDRLDEVCGIMGWQCRYVPMHDKKTVCEIGLYSEAHAAWLWKSDGAGDSDIEAEKGALSDAFKRAAVRWGIGRYLYDLDSPWVALEPAGHSFKIATHEYARLEALLRGTYKPPTREEKGDALKKARAWAAQAIHDIHGFSTAEELAEWESKNTSALVRLRSVDPDTHHEVLEAIQGK